MRYSKSAVFSGLVSALLISSCTGELSRVSNVQTGSPSSIHQDVELTPDQIEKAMFVPGELVVKFTPEMAEMIEKGQADPSADIAAELGLKSIERLFPYAGEYEARTRAEGLHTFYIVDFDTRVPVSTAQKLFESVEGVQLVEKTSVKKLYTNDTRYSSQWEYKTTNNYNIHAEEAWQYTMGKPEVVVCVVDEGIQLDHEDLAWNCGTTHYNFVRSNTTIVGGDHGTHVAGSIAAVGNNGKGIIGIAGGDYSKSKRGVTLLSAQVFQGNSSARAFETAIKWGADNGAVISQNSWGNNYDFNGDGQLTGQELTYALNDEITASMAAGIDYFIKYAGCDKNGNQKPDSPMKGGVVIFAAGNDGIINGVPANYDPNITVGATNSSGRLTSWSNYGPWVDICAPGDNIISCVPTSSYGGMSGTSMACPHISGAAALICSYFGKQGFTNADLEDILVSGATPGLINCSGKDMGPYLNLEGSIKYGIDKYRRQTNEAPVIETSYTGNFEFCQWQNVSIPFMITDPDEDVVTVTTEIDGRGKLIKDEKVDHQYNFTVLCEAVTDFTPKKAKIIATDTYKAVTTKEFTYKVIKNRAPEVAGSIDNVLFTDSERAVTIDLSNLFTDADNEPLRYSAKVDNDKITSVDVDGNFLAVKRLGNGLATVTVKAKDYMGDEASFTFKTLSRDESYDVDYYPNPVRNFLNIRISSTQGKDVKVKITSASGEVKFDDTVVCSAFNPGQVDMSSYAPGQYSLKLSFNDKQYENVIIKL